MQTLSCQAHSCRGVGLPRAIGVKLSSHNPTPGRPQGSPLRTTPLPPLQRLRKRMSCSVFTLSFLALPFFFLTKTTKKDELFRVFVRAGVVRTRGWDPCGRPGGWVEAYLAVALAMIPALAPCPCGRPGVGHSPPAQHAHLTPIGRGLSPPLGLIKRYTENSACSFAPHSPYPRKSS